MFDYTPYQNLRKPFPESTGERPKETPKEVLEVLAWNNAVDAVLGAMVTGRLSGTVTKHILALDAKEVVSTILPFLNGCPDHDTAARKIHEIYGS